MDHQLALKRIAETLLVEYSSVYYVNAKTNEYEWFSADRSFNSLQLEQGGGDFFENVVRDTERVVYEEDKPLILEALSKEVLLDKLKRGDVKDVRYRLVIDGQPVWHILRLIRGFEDGDDYFILGVLNVDRQMREQEEQERIRKEHEVFNHIAESLAAQYDTIYYVNTETDHYIEFSATDIYKNLGVPVEGEDFFAESARNIQRVIHPEDCERILNLFVKEHLITRMNEVRSFYEDYRLHLGEGYKYTRLSVIWAADHLHIIIGVENIDEQVRRELERQAVEAQNVTYSQIAESLATRYDSIYYVDTLTDNYTEYSATREYKKLKIETAGEDFFADSARNIRRVIYKDDMAMVLEALKKDVLLANLEDNQTFSMTYRLLLGENPTYVNLRVVWAKDGRHIIIGLANVDAEIRKENEHMKALRQAHEQARRDELTGVRNKNAYREEEGKLEQSLASGETTAFGIVVCDVNGLKEVNDTQGHKAGDEYIRSACRMICRIYAHSPVFRIGGDEFVVVLRGRDYEAREGLMDEIRTEVLANQESGRVIIATGMSEYDPGEDRKVADVFARADGLMYENKKTLKGARL